VAVLPSMKVSVTVPTVVSTTLPGSNGSALNGGLVVVKTLPL
jgi:hypothetical protein